MAIIASYTWRVRVFDEIGNVIETHERATRAIKQEVSARSRRYKQPRGGSQGVAFGKLKKLSCMHYE